MTSETEPLPWKRARDLLDAGALAEAASFLRTGGTTMLSWPDALCEALATGGRHVVRYDLRDSGASTTVSSKAPAYRLRALSRGRTT